MDSYKGLEAISQGSKTCLYFAFRKSCLVLSNMGYETNCSPRRLGSFLSADCLSFLRRRWQSYRTTFRGYWTTSAKDSKEAQLPEWILSRIYQPKNGGVICIRRKRRRRSILWPKERSWIKIQAQRTALRSDLSVLAMSILFSLIPFPLKNLPWKMARSNSVYFEMGNQLHSLLVL